MKNLYKTQNKLFGFVIFLAFSLVASISLTSQHAFAFSGNGAGTSDDPYKVTNCSQWLQMANDLSASYIVSGNIDCTGTTYTPIGTSGAPFTGSLDGGGWEISGVTITSGDHIGLFGYTNGATIKNFDFASSTISGNFPVGGIIGDATDTTISRVRSTVDITATDSAGGLVGNLRGSSLIEKSSFNGTVASPGGLYIAGLVSTTYGSPIINDSYAAGTLDVNNTWEGGLVGLVSSGTLTINRSYSAMTFTHTHSFNGGLIAQFAAGTVTDSFSVSTLDGSVSGAGGLFGNGFGTSTNNYFDAYLANTTNCNGVGGSAACTPVNSSNSTPNYFKNNSANAPLDNWDFTGIWSTSVGNYPQLSQIPSSEIQCEIPTSKQTTIHVFCDVQSIGDVGTLTWYARYRIVGASGWTSFTPADPSTGTIDITGLKAGTKYEVSFKYVSSLYGTSYWISTDTTTKTATTTSQSSGSNSSDDTIIQSSTANSGYGPVNADIFTASATKPKITKRTSDTDPKPIYDNPASLLKPKDTEKANNILRNILIACGAVAFLALVFNFFKPPTPVSGK